MIMQLKIRDADENLPRVVKFSGGRTSGMMLLMLLEHGHLDPLRGDVVIFNNTSAEHPKTYEFVCRIKEYIELRYQVPLFIVEWQTYEHYTRKRWVRTPCYRLAFPTPHDAETAPRGYRWRGEIFEEMISHTRYVPNQNERICTQHLKSRAGEMFLDDWFSGAAGYDALGHNEPSKIDLEVAYDEYRTRIANRLDPKTKKPIKPKTKEEYIRNRQFAIDSPAMRPAGRFVDFARRCHISPNHESHRVYDNYVSIVGLRADEPRRVKKTMQKLKACGAPDEKESWVYLPLAQNEITERDVRAFWRERPQLDLELKAEDCLSNCTFCFLKGKPQLRQAYKATQNDPGNMLKGTPSDLQWWVDIEQKYGRTHGENDQFYGFRGDGRTFDSVLTDFEDDPQYELDLFCTECTD